MADSAARARITQARQEQLAQQKKHERRRKLAVRIGVPLAAAVVVAIVLSVVATLPRGTTGTAASASSSTSATSAASAASASAVAAKATSVPASVLDAAGGTGVAVPPAAITAPALTNGGKPEVLYVGAEYCPFCAAERWPMVVALSRFGTFRGLGLTASEPNDVYPNTATLTFEGSTYTSDYISFTGREIENRNGQPLDKLTDAQQKLLSVYDAAPYTQSSGAIPFVDLGGKYLINGASYNPQILQGKTHMQIAKALHDPTSTVGKSVDAVANAITASICNLTNHQPANVCTSAGVVAAAKLLKTT